MVERYQKITAHKVEVEDVRGEGVVPMKNKPEEGRGSYFNGEECSSLTGGNSNDDGVVQILELMS